MTPEGIKYRRFDMAAWVTEACGVVTRCAAAHNPEHARHVYRLDEWEYNGTRDGGLHPLKALDVLQIANEIDEAARIETGEVDE